MESRTRITAGRSPCDRPPRLRRLAFGTLLGGLFALWSALPAAAFELRLATDNDFLTTNSISDDYYTFGMRIELSFDELTVRLDEDAFTNRTDELRFDETRLTVGRLAPRPWLGRWWAWGELGILRVGEGLLGQSAQNTVHELIGNPPVELPYIDEEETHAFLGLEAGRQFRLGSHWTLGPQLSLRSNPGFKTSAVAAVRSIWRPSPRLSVDVILGGRFADTSSAYLEPVLQDLGPAAVLELELPYRFVLECYHNRYGTERQHVSFGYRIGGGGSPRRSGALRELDRD